MKTDILNRNDIERLVNIFYEKVLAEEQIGSIFSEMAKVNWDNHLTAMYNFWENIILFTGTYDCMPVNLIKHLHHTRPLKKTDFDRWNQLFISTVDELFYGEKASLTKQRAIRISGIIMDRIFE